MISKELILQARQANLAIYLLNRGEPLKRSGSRRYKHQNHDSLVITENAFYWNSKGSHGNAIDFLQLFYEMDFKTAVMELTNASENEKRLASDANTVQVSQTFVMPALHTDMRRSFAYLIKSRFVDSSIIQKLAKEKLLFQDQNGNAVFPWYNEKQQIIGAELQGTLTDIRYKGISEGSNYGYGYNIIIGSPTSLYVFESAVDLLSFWSLHKSLTDSLLVSMGGLKAEVIEGFLSRSQSLQNLYCCVDNDKAGQDFVEALKANIDVQELYSPNGKDWNDALKFSS